MKIPNHPANELQRLQTLQSLKILDTEPEERFDRITRIAQRLFDVPIVLVSLIDAERQWFKSRQGLCTVETHRNISFCGHTILEDEIFIVPDALLDGRFSDNPLVVGAPNIRFYASTPVFIDSYAIGTLCLIDQSPRSFSADDRALLRDLGKMVEQELISANLGIFDELKQRNSEMKGLGELSDFLQSCLTIQEACAVITNLLESLFPHCSGGIFLISKYRDGIENITTWGSTLYSQTEFTTQDCWGMRRGRLHRVGSDRLGLRCQHITHAPAHANTLCIPMIAQGETLGLFFLSTQSTDILSDAKQQLASNVSEQIGLAIANLHLRETLQQQKVRDPFTHLFNRCYLTESLQLEIIRAQRKEYSIGLIMMDLDHFKRFNTNHGNEAGDAILQAISKMVRSKIRGSDIACRYGGEEIILVLPEASLEDTERRADTLRIAISQLQIHQAGQIIGPITASFGVACFPRHGATGTDLIQTADAALYRAKAAGRNQVITAP